MTPGRMTSEGTAVQRHKATQTRARRKERRGKTDGGPIAGGGYYMSEGVVGEAECNGPGGGWCRDSRADGATVDNEGVATFLDLEIGSSAPAGSSVPGSCLVRATRLFQTGAFHVSSRFVASGQGAPKIPSLKASVACDRLDGRRMCSDGLTYHELAAAWAGGRGRRLWMMRSTCVRARVRRPDQLPRALADVHRLES